MDKLQEDKIISKFLYKRYRYYRRSWIKENKALLERSDCQTNYSFEEFTNDIGKSTYEHLYKLENVEENRKQILYSIREEKLKRINK